MDVDADFTWYGDPLEGHLRREMEQRLRQIGEYVRRVATRKLRRKKFPPASSPGSAPAYRTGHLSRSVFYEVDKVGLRVRIGTAVKYGLYLELGTKRVAARPWLRPSLEQSRLVIVSILAKRLPLPKARGRKFR